MIDLDTSIARLPQDELHPRTEGSLEPEPMVSLATRNRIVRPLAGAEEMLAAINLDGRACFGGFTAEHG